MYVALAKIVVHTITDTNTGHMAIPHYTGHLVLFIILGDVLRRTTKRGWGIKGGVT